MTAADAGAALAAELAAANAEVIAFVESCTDEQWATVVPGPQWPVAVVAHHIARGHLHMIEWLELVRHGRDITETAAAIDADNERHARDDAGVTRGATVDGLERHGAALVGVLQGLTIEDLERSVAFGPARGMAVTAAQLAPVAARHCREHLEDARRALGGPTGTT